MHPEFFHIVGNDIVDYADGTTIYTVIPKPILLLQLMESLNRDLAAIKSCCIKWHMKFNLKKIIQVNRDRLTMVVNRSRTIVPDYGDHTLIAELEEVENLRTLGVTLDSNLTFET